jgi:hypothetical protein
LAEEARKGTGRISMPEVRGAGVMLLVAIDKPMEEVIELVRKFHLTADLYYQKIIEFPSVHNYGCFIAVGYLIFDYRPMGGFTPYEIADHKEFFALTRQLTEEEYKAATFVPESIQAIDIALDDLQSLN